jgi:hypothetical protein
VAAVWFFENPNTSINGIDIRNSFDPFKQEENISAYVFDASNVNQFNSVFGDKNFDIILDDGAHEKESQVDLFNLYSHKIKPGGLYVIEDIQCISDDIEYFVDKIKKKPTIIDRRFINEQLDDVMLVYRF